MVTRDNGRDVSEESRDNLLFTSLSNIKFLTNKLIKELKDLQIKITTRNIRKVSSLFTNKKDLISMPEKSNVVYKIPCQQCEKTYKGQTQQKLKKRMAGYKSDIKNHPERFALVLHANKEHRRPNFDDTTVLNIESKYTKKLFLEMYHINNEQHKINKKTDSNKLSSIYTYLISNEWNINNRIYLGVNQLFVNFEHLSNYLEPL